MDSTNISFLKRNSPVRVTLYGVLFWFLLFIFVPVKVKYSLSFFPVLYIVLNYLFFIIGINSIKTTNQERLISYSVNIPVLKKIMYVVIFIALTGVSLKVFDRFYLRGSSFSNSMSENRELLGSTGPSIISIISAITNPFSFVPLFIYYYIKLKNKKLFIVCLALFFSASIEFVVLGSRSGLFLLLVLFGVYLFYFKKIKLNYKRVISISLFVFFLGIYSINLFVERTKDFAKTDKKAIKHILTNANYNFTIEPTKETKDAILNSSNKTYVATRLGLINFVQYYTHGMYEFGYLYNNYIGGHHYGSYTFSVFAKFSNILFKTNIDLEAGKKSFPRKGIYTTFYGPIYADFGWFSLVFVFLMGIFQKLIYNKVLLGRFQYTPLLFYFLIINFFIPVINFINGAQGIYALTAFTIFAFIYTLLSGNIIISRKDNKTKYFRILKNRPHEENYR